MKTKINIKVSCLYLFDHLFTSFILYFLFIPVALNEDSEHFIYQVKKGDMLSKIIKRYFPRHDIYGKKGKIQELVAKNPTIKNPDLIFPNQEIKFKINTSNQLEIKLITTDNLLDQSNISQNSVDEKMKIDHLEEKIKELKVVELEDFETNILLANNEINSTDSSDDHHFDHQIRTSPQEKLIYSSSMDLSTFYGMRFFNFHQKGSFGTTKISGTLFNNLKIKSFMDLDLFNLNIFYDTYNFEVAYQNSSTGKVKQENRMHNLDLYSTFGFLSTGLSFNQNPLIRNRSNILDLVTEQTWSVDFGVGKDIHFKDIYNRQLKILLSAHLKIPFIFSTNNPGVQVDSSSGVMLDGSLQVAKELSKKRIYLDADENLKFYVNWMNNIFYQKIDQEINWLEENKGKSSLTKLDFSSSLGLTLEY